MSCMPTSGQTIARQETTDKPFNETHRAVKTWLHNGHIGNNSTILKGKSKFEGPDSTNAYLMAEECICQVAKVGEEIYTASLNLLETDKQNRFVSYLQILLCSFGLQLKNYRNQMSSKTAKKIKNG